MAANRATARVGYAQPAIKGRLARAGDQPLKPRNGWTIWLPLSLLVMLATGLVVMHRETVTGFLNRPIDVVKVTTPLIHVSEGEVRRLLAAYMHEGFFHIDVGGVKQGLETHPWVARAEVKRVWPNAIALAVTEEIAIARWGERSLLNQYGRKFTPMQLGDSRTLPLLAGPEGTEAKMMEQFQAFNQILYDTGLRIERLNLSDRGSWSLQASSGIRLVVGKDEVRDRLKRFAAIYDKRLANDIADIEKIDLRYSNGFTVKKKPLDLSKVAAR